MRKGGAFLMASDTLPGMPFRQGNNFAINIECENIPEIERLFTALGEGGKVTNELQDTFWNARFGSLTDRFGVNWMFNCELPKQG
jgi:PhnB protein